ncbi:hypothetical protein [Alicyclobacillus sp. ALC3]|uniref:hypothetical protein n=1 Tax=Alicyclobacillus sp. ALC3 TaxID=2796143 RepID=UPI0023782683|nr:hypothetical protein [Alicyclobacillus sp. ALC3]WDL98468.1 hypothetical protein JC200_07235 [Alicyclobacillus sp. ALC3]
MAVGKDELHRMIDGIEDPKELRLVFEAIHSIVDGHGEHRDLDAWQRGEIEQALKEADEEDFASVEEVERFTDNWL